MSVAVHLLKSPESKLSSKTYAEERAPWLARAIIEMWFQGYSRDETVEILTVSEGTVSNIVRSLPPCLAPLRDLSKLLRKLGLTANEALERATIHQLMAQYRLTPEEVTLFFEAIKKWSTEKAYQPEKVIQAYTEIMKIEHQSGKAYPEATREFETATQQTPELVRQNSQLQLEIQKNRQACEESFEQAKTTSEELSEYRDTKIAFRKNGINMKNIKTIRRVLDNIKEAGGNTKHIVSNVKKHDSLAKSVDYLDEQLPIKQKEYCRPCQRHRRSSKNCFSAQR